MLQMCFQKLILFTLTADSVFLSVHYLNQTFEKPIKQLLLSPKACFIHRTRLIDKMGAINNFISKK